MASVDETATNSADLPLLLTIEEAAEVLRIGRTLAYRLARLHDDTAGCDGLPVIRVGRVLRVPRPAFEHYLATGRPPQPATDERLPLR